MCTPLLAWDTTHDREIPVKLCYNPDTPMAIRLSIHHNNRWIAWTLDRNMLGDAQLHPVQHGDIACQRHRGLFILSLYPLADNQLMLVFNNDDIYTYLQWTWAQVPPCRNPERCYDTRCPECNALRPDLDLDCDLLTLSPGEPE